jgi:mono/diheme cytochrome c family protein
MKAPRMAYILSALAVVSTGRWAGCAAPTAGQLPIPAELAAPQAQEAILRRGRALAVTKCATCHRLYWPREYPPEAWPGIVRSMGRQASLSESQGALVEAYYVAGSKSEHGGGKPPAASAGAER